MDVVELLWNIYNGSNVILTCGHGGQSGGNTIKYSNNNGNTIGTVVYHRCNNNQIGDFEIVSVNSSLFDISRSVANYRLFDGLVYNPGWNTNVRYYGTFSGGESSGKVVATGVIGTPENENIDIYGLTMMKVLSGDCRGGDSGSPIYLVDNNYALFCGVLSGSYFDEDEGYLYVMFTPYTYINEVGFSAYVSD